MKDFAPAYYEKFHCIADRCKHNCCIGWEVDIDPVTLEKYRNMPSSLGEDIRRSIKEEDGVYFFAMTSEGKCPFLCRDGLCRIIKESGEEALCDICREHPRFYNFFTDRTEWGLGLSCEEAAKIIISDNAPFSLGLIADDGENEENDDFENYVLFMRNECIKIVSEKGVSLTERIETLFSFCEAKMPPQSGKEIFSLLFPLERLDSEWEKKLFAVKNIGSLSVLSDKRYELWFENLLSYFIYRHISQAVYDDKISERASFACFSLFSVASLCQAFLDENKELTLYDITEISRAYSAEIEYSQENTEALIESFV